MSGQNIYVEIVDDLPIEVDLSDSEVIIVELGEGMPGPKGEGVPAGGTQGQALYKRSDVDYDTEWRTPAPGGAFDGIIGPEGIPWYSIGGKLFNCVLTDEGRFVPKEVALSGYPAVYGSTY